MRSWNGYRLETLRQRKWSQVFLDSKTLADLNPTAFVKWFDEHQSSGRWYVDVSAWTGNTYYFENSKDATIFALRWA